MTQRKLVYNLEFPAWCPELNIFGYRFSRIADYEAEVACLQHLENSHEEFWIYAKTGEHKITAEVEIPENEEKAVLPWNSSDETALIDVFVLLSIFTRRNLFMIGVDELFLHEPVLVDPRVYQWGKILRSGIDETLEIGLNQVYSLIRSEAWQQKYRQGSFLLLVESALRRQDTETTFIQCWTIWEHLFAVLNDNWLSDEAIRNLRPWEKIAFLIKTFALIGPIDESVRNSHIKPLAKIRNRVVHFGRFPQANSTEEGQELWKSTVLFILLTEFIIAKILGLFPSQNFTSMEELEIFLVGTNDSN